MTVYPLLPIALIFLVQVTDLSTEIWFVSKGI